MSPVLALLLAASPEALSGTQRFALLAGANDGGPGRTELRYAVSDAEAMATVLQELGGVAPGDTVLLVEPDTGELEVGFAQLLGMVEAAREAGDRAEVVVYYSGHSDAEGLLLAGERYGYDALRRALDEVPADVRLLVLDSCASGAMTRTKGGSFQAPFLLDQSVDVSGYAYLTSSSADEVAQEADHIGGSYFTHFLVSGLRGGADHSADGRVTLNEAYQFAYSETLARTERSVGGAQHATYDIQLSGTGDLVVTELAATSARLLLAEELEGRLFVRDKRGDLVVELRKDAGRPLSLGLAPGDYTVLLEGPMETREAAVTLVDGEPLLLELARFRRVALAQATARGPDPDLPVVHVPFTVGIIPGKLGGRGNEVRVHHLDLSLGGSSADRLAGFQGSLVVNHVVHDARGFQGTVGANVATDVYGAQSSVGANVAERVQGFQATVGGNVAQEVSGLQAAVGLNLADRMTGIQLGVAPNVAGELQGAQIGLINIAGTADMQLGLVNIAEDADVSVGIISINGAGYNHLYTTFGFSDFATIGLTYGGKQLYSVADFSPGEQMRLGLGLGWHQPIGGEGLFLDTDITGSTYGSRLFSSEDPGLIARGRMVFGIGWKRLAFFIGPDITVGVIESESGPYGTRFNRVGPGDVEAGGQMGVRL